MLISRHLHVATAIQQETHCGPRRQSGSKTLGGTENSIQRCFADNKKWNKSVSFWQKQELQKVSYAVLEKSSSPVGQKKTDLGEKRTTFFVWNIFVWSRLDFFFKNSLRKYLSTVNFGLENVFFGDVTQLIILVGRSELWEELQHKCNNHFTK